MRRSPRLSTGAALLRAIAPPAGAHVLERVELQRRARSRAPDELGGHSFQRWLEQWRGRPVRVLLALDGSHVLVVADPPIGQLELFPRAPAQSVPMHRAPARSSSRADGSTVRFGQGTFGCYCPGRLERGASSSPERDA